MGASGFTRFKTTRVNPAPRKWAAEGLQLKALAELNGAKPCRVCGKMVVPAEMCWQWNWKSTEVGHLACGWYRIDDDVAIRTLRFCGTALFPKTAAMLGWPIRQPLAHRTQQLLEHALIQRDPETKAWILSPCGLALVRQLRAAAEHGKAAE